MVKSSLTGWVRCSGAFALIFSLLATLTSVQPAVAQTGNSSIELHIRVCPPNYQGTNHFDDCHGNTVGAGYAFTFTNEATGEVHESSTNADGNVGFANLSQGTYTIVGGPPGDVTETFVYCAVGTAAEPNQERIPVEYVSGGIQFHLPADTNVICDWYSIPIGQAPTDPAPTATEAPAANSSIEVHHRVCPADYAGTNWFEDCHANVADPGLPFTFTDGVTREGATNENGNVGFANLPAGTYTITGGAPGNVSDYFVYCSPEGVQAEVPVSYVTGGIQVELTASTNLVCDWYTIPLSQDGETPAPTEPVAADSSIEVHHRVCPTDYEGTDYYQDCHGNAADAGLSFTFADGVTREGTTNENGNVGFANLPAGTYTITGGVPGDVADYLAYCSNESTNEEVSVDYITGGIQLDLPANTNLVCDWYAIPYNLQGDPTATQPSENQFDLPIYKLLCDSAPAEQARADFLMLGTLPEACEQFAGTTVTVTDGAGTELGSCVTEADDACFVTVPVGSTVYGTEDLTTVPEGYAPVDGETIELKIEPATEASLLFVNVASQEPDTFDLPIYTLLCETDPGNAVGDFVLGGSVPEGCEQYAGASVTITAPDGTPYGTCQTNANEACYVTVAIGTEVVATIDPDTLPADYTVVGSQTREIEIPPASEAWVLFTAVPSASASASTPSPTATTVPTQISVSTVTPTPETLEREGRIVALHEGACELAEPGAVVVELPNLMGPEPGSATDTDADVIIAETSTATIDFALNDLMAGEYALIAYSGDEDEAPVACTAIDGEMNAAGELVLGVQEVNNSGFAGIAYMATTADGTQTAISVFLGDGLAADEEDDAAVEMTATPVE